MDIEIRKVVRYQDTSLIEGGKKAEKPLQLFAAAAVVTILGQDKVLWKI